jgi:nucleoside-diphosphate-sugar epimerase
MPDLLTGYVNKKVLVTGAAGAVGSNLCTQLALRGAKVLAVDDLSASERWNLAQIAGIDFFRADILNEPNMREAFGEKPDVVFHLASFFANQHSIECPERDLLVNGMGTLRMLELAREFQIGRFIYASTSAAYRESDDVLTESESSLRPTSPYQISKITGEQYCSFFHSYYGLNVVKVRFFNCYGPGEIPGPYRNVIPKFIYQALKGDPLTITGTGYETRDFTYVEDIVDGLLRIAFSELLDGEEVNLASGVETEIVRLAESINLLTGNRAGITYGRKREWDGHKRRRGSFNRARCSVGYEPRVFLPEGLERTLRWFETHWERIDRIPRLLQGDDDINCFSEGVSRAQ